MNATVSNLPSTERRSVLVSMASKYNMEPAAFEQTLRATVFPEKGTREQFAAVLVVANEYELNPILKEIYAFPTKGGGVVPIVSIDGWLNIINSHPMLNGIEFDDHLEGDKVSAITARIWRKDREKPIVVTEYLAECHRPTDPWKQYPRRMLRHKALIQCARYAFGFAGIVDPDEAERMGADVSPMRDVTVRRDDGPPPPSAIEHQRQAPATTERDRAEVIDAKTGEILDGNDPDIPGFLDRREKSPPTQPDGVNEKEWINDLMGAFSGCEDFVSFGQKQKEVMAPFKTRVSSEAWTTAQHLAEDTFKRIQAAG